MVMVMTTTMTMTMMIGYAVCTYSVQTQNNEHVGGEDCIIIGINVLNINYESGKK